EQVLGQDDIEAGRVRDQVHGTGVNVHVIQLDLGKIPGDLVDGGAPELRGFEHVRLIDRCDLLPALARLLESDARHALDLPPGVAHGVEGDIAVFAEAAGLGEVKTSQQFSDNQYIGALDAGAFQRRTVSDRRKGDSRT